MNNLYIYKTIEDYFYSHNQDIDKKALDKLENVSSHIEDISNFLEELHLSCVIYNPYGTASNVIYNPYGTAFNFEFCKIIDNSYQLFFDLDCLNKGFRFYIEDARASVVYPPSHRYTWHKITRLKQEIKKFMDWLETD